MEEAGTEEEAEMEVKEEIRWREEDQEVIIVQEPEMEAVEVDGEE